LDLEPGSSLDFLLGTFTPNNGNAAAGVYTLLSTNIVFWYHDPNAPADMQDYFSTVTSTCASLTASCGLTRTVLGTAAGAVPEPASWALMMIGLGGLGAALRARRRPEGVTPSAA
jgi:hypothetical protein